MKRLVMDKKSKWMVALMLFTFILGGLLIMGDEHNRPSGAFAENLWTSEGQWKRQNPDSDWGEWTRKGFGIGWNWLVIDTDTTSDAWQARLDYFCLMFYVFVASIPSVVFLCVVSVAARHKAKMTITASKQ